MWYPDDDLVFQPGAPGSQAVRAVTCKQQTGAACAPRRRNLAVEKVTTPDPDPLAVGSLLWPHTGDIERLFNLVESQHTFKVVQPSLCKGSQVSHPAMLQTPEDKMPIIHMYRWAPSPFRAQFPRAALLLPLPRLATS